MESSSIPKKLLDELDRWVAQKKYGEISIKFNNGHIVHMTRTESIKVDVIFVNNPDTKISVLGASDTIGLVGTETP